MKTIFTIVFSLFLFSVLSAQAPIELPFFDDFEETISEDATFQNWTTENLEGWHYWHLIPWGGAGGGQCMRFENTDIDQNDWLISKSIDTEETEKLQINFNHFYHTPGTKPKLLYTTNYDGDASQNDWTEIEYSLGGNENEWYSSDEFIIETPGDTIWIAFQYKAVADEGIYFLLDNFSVKEYVPPPTYELVGNTEHFEFYTSISGEEDFYLAIRDSLEKQFDKLSSLWNRPGIEDVFMESEKIKVYYSEKNDIYLVNEKTPRWKCGFHHNSSKEIYLAPLENQQQTNFYGNFSKLAVNEFSQLAISLKFLRENNSYFPPYFLEGFGLYESGFRPERNDVIQYVNNGFEFSYITDTIGISNNSIKKSLTIANIEGQVLTPWSYLGVNPGASSFIASQWQNYLKHFYTKPESDRIKLQHSSEHFNFYSADSDNGHMDEAYTYFENACSYYIENYNYEPDHRFNVVFCPTEPIGMDLTTYSRFNGGAGCGGDLVMELSPNYNYNEEIFYSDYFGYAGLCAHEFFHIYYNHFMWEIPGGFWAEGTADFSQRHSLNWPIPEHSLWNIDALFSDYKDKYNVDINLEHISSNPNGELNIYFLGDMFFEFLYQNYGGYENIRKFFNQGMDYSVFGATYEEIDTGYINYLKSLAEISTETEVFENENESKLEIQNNPMTNEVVMSFNILKNGKVNLSVFDLQGRKITTILHKNLPAGSYNYSLRKNFPTDGIYFLRLKTQEGISTQKFVFKNE